MLHHKAHFVMMWSQCNGVVGVQAAFFGTVMVVVNLKHMGINAWDSRMLKMSARTFASCSEQSLMAPPGIRHSPAALCGWTLESLSHMQNLVIYQVVFFFLPAHYSVSQMVRRSPPVGVGGLVHCHRSGAEACSR